MAIAAWREHDVDSETINIAVKGARCREVSELLGPGQQIREDAVSRP